VAGIRVSTLAFDHGLNGGCAGAYPPYKSAEIVERAKDQDTALAMQPFFKLY